MKTILLALLLLVAGVKTSRAGELFTEHFSLSEVAEKSGKVVLAKALEISEQTSELKAKVQKTWSSENSENYASLREINEQTSEFKAKVQKTWPVENSGEYSAGRVYVFPIYKGIEWTDPGESPIEKRLADSIRINEIKPGQKVLIVSRGATFELLPATRSKIREVENLFKGEGKKK